MYMLMSTNHLNMRLKSLFIEIKSRFTLYIYSMSKEIQFKMQTFSN